MTTFQHRGFKSNIPKQQLSLNVLFSNIKPYSHKPKKYTETLDTQP